MDYYASLPPPSSSPYLTHRNDPSAARARPDTRPHALPDMPVAAKIGLEESLLQMTLHPPFGVDASAGPYPERPGQPDCVYYLRTGTCGYGVNCRFNHPSVDKVQISANDKEELPERFGQPECQYYMKTGTCKFGAVCKYHHPQQRTGFTSVQVQLNFLGLPLRPAEKDCGYYLRTGSCKFGVTCKFHHPQPTPLGTVLPLSGSPLYPTSAPASPTPYHAALPSWPMARAPYMRGTGLPGPSTYMPVLVSPQSLSVSGWNAYQELDATAAGTTGSRGFTSSTVSDQMDTTFPERPGQPDCRHFMKTGDCKFGFSCKYHHPKDRVISTLPSALSPMGLPIRPGQPPCTFYIKYGICKFGPTCKFDHPIGGLSYNPSTSSLYDVPIVPYPSVSSPTTVASTSSERSHQTSRVEDIVPSNPDKPESQSVENCDSGKMVSEKESHNDTDGTGVSSEV